MKAKDGQRLEATTRIEVFSMGDTFGGGRVLFAVETDESKAGDLKETYEHIIYDENPNRKMHVSTFDHGVVEDGTVLKPTGYYDESGCEIMVQDGYGQDMGYRGLCASVQVRKAFKGLTIDSLNGTLPKDRYTMANGIIYDEAAIIEYIQDCAIDTARKMGAVIPSSDKLLNMGSLGFAMETKPEVMDDDDFREHIDRTYFSTPRVEYEPPEGFTVLHAITGFTDPTIKLYSMQLGEDGIPCWRNAGTYFLCEDDLVDYYISRGLADRDMNYTRWVIDPWQAKRYKVDKEPTRFDDFIEWSRENDMRH